MQHSEQIDAFAKALALAQGEMEHAKKDSKNPHYGSAYADLASVRDACADALAKHSIAVLQFPRLLHALDDQWLVDTLAVPLVKLDAQAEGSALTYGRRYALAAITGVAPADADDDGNAAIGRPSAPPSPTPLETAVGKVLGLTSRPAGVNGTRWVVTLSNHKTYGTLREGIAEIIKGAQEAASEVEIRFKATPRGNEIIFLRDLSQPEPPC
jgi:ERF superfamily